MDTDVLVVVRTDKVDGGGGASGLPSQLNGYRGVMVIVDDPDTIAALAEPGGVLAIAVNPVAELKCERCWHWRADVGADQAHPTLCGRCVSNLFGPGDRREYA